MNRRKIPTDTARSIHDIRIDPRNRDILISINGTLYPRAAAMLARPYDDNMRRHRLG
jgi:hypothetical protein